MNSTQAGLRDEVRQLAKEAFQHNLISGYGDGSNSGEFQIVFHGKPRHLSLERARSFLVDLIAENYSKTLFGLHD
jgi:hypothetical protein